MNSSQQGDDVPASESRHRLVVAVALSAIIAITWIVYLPATSGTFLLDDFDNLGQLELVSDAESAWYFVLSGTGGPTGRPVALATFLPQAEHWAKDPAPFLRINILIHLLNGVLVFVLLRQLAGPIGLARADADFFALSATALWLLMPLLASSSLMIVQRMTTLSGTFVLGGLCAYLAARARLESRPDLALVGMAAALVLASLFAFLSKENGALLPVYVLALETTVLPKPGNVSMLKWRAWTSVFLVAPLAIVVAYLLAYASYDDGMLARRQFSGFERLITQAGVLWQYLAAALVPRPGIFSPFHDAYPVSRSRLQPSTFIAVVAWLATIFAALRWRRTYPVFAFAVFWYLGGHLLESTTLPLELYFEHRNYLPVIGPVAALVLLAVRVTPDTRKYARSAVAGLVVLNAAVLWSVTSLWGSPTQAATRWHQQNPQSVRAATTLATRHMEEMGGGVALITLDAFAETQPQHGYIKIPALNIACRIAPDRDHSARLDDLNAGLPGADFSVTTAVMLDQLLATISRPGCMGIDASALDELLAALDRNPAYRLNATFQQQKHQLLASRARMDGDIETTIAELARASEYKSDDNLTMMMIITLVEDGQFDAAREFLEASMQRASTHPLKKRASQIYLDGLASYIDEAEQLTETAHDAGPDPNSERSENGGS